MEKMRIADSQVEDLLGQKKRVKNPLVPIERFWTGLEDFVFDWLINADRVVSQVDYPSLVDLRGLLLDLVAQLLGALSHIRFSSVTERFFMELNTRRIDTSVARSETLISIINGIHYLKLGVRMPYK